MKSTIQRPITLANDERLRDKAEVKEVESLLKRWK